MPSFDVAGLNIAITSSSAVTATGNLKALSAQSVKTEGAISSLTATAGKMAAGFLSFEAARRGATYAVNAFSVLDKGLIGIRKTTGIAGDELASLGEQIQTIGATVPVSTNELLNIAQAAGQLGVSGSANILKFTKTVGMMGVASDLAGEEAAMTLARLLTVTGETADQVDVLGSVIVALGNNMAATEKEIAWMATQVAQATSVFGVSSAEAVALGAAMRSIGVRAELGGSAVGRAMRAMDKAIRGGGESFVALQKITGLTADSLRKTFEDDAVSAFVAFEEGIRRVNAAGGDVTATLAQFGLQGEEILKVLPALANSSDELRRALGLASNELKNNTALTDEATAAAEAYEARMTLVGNRMDKLAASLGERLGPAIASFSETFVGALEKIDRQALDNAATSAGGVFSYAKGYVDYVNMVENAERRFEKISKAVAADAKIMTDGLTFGQVAPVGLEKLVDGYTDTVGNVGVVSKEASTALKDVNTEFARLTMTAAEFEKFQISQQYEAWAEALGRTNPELAKTVALMRQLAAARAITSDQRNLLITGEQNRSQWEQQRALINDVDNSAVTSARQAAAQKDLSLVAEFSEKYRELTLGDTQFKLSQIDAQAQAYLDAGADEVAVADWVSDEKRKASKEWYDGATRYLDDYANDATDWASNIESVLSGAFSGAEDALVDFVTTGKASFSDLANSIIEDIARIAIRQSITGPLAQGISSFIGGMFTSGAAASANGNVFSGGDISRYSGSIVTQPTFFSGAHNKAYAMGGNVMGEAGPEAILPLTRTSGGKLGVEAKGSAPVINFTVIDNAGVGVSTETEQNSDGGVNIAVMLDKQNAANISRPGSATRRAMAAAQNPLTNRG